MPEFNIGLLSNCLAFIFYAFYSLNKYWQDLHLYFHLVICHLYVILIQYKGYIGFGYKDSESNDFAHLIVDFMCEGCLLSELFHFYWLTQHKMTPWSTITTCTFVCAVWEIGIKSGKIRCVTLKFLRRVICHCMSYVEITTHSDRHLLLKTSLGPTGCPKKWWHDSTAKTIHIVSIKEKFPRKSCHLFFWENL